ncbi:hypothetical protein Tco_0216434 [Tanacetum coccineum]
MQYRGINKDTKCWNGSCVTPVEYILDDAVYAYLYAGRMETSSFNHYNSGYTGKQKLQNLMILKKNIKFKGGLFRIKSLLNAASVTVAHIRVNAA